MFQWVFFHNIFFGLKEYLACTCLSLQSSQSLFETLAEIFLAVKESIQRQADELAQEIMLNEIEYESLKAALAKASTIEEQTDIEKQLEMLNSYFESTQEKLKELQTMLSPDYVAKPSFNQKAVQAITLAASIGLGAYAGYRAQKSFFEQNPYYRSATGEELKMHDVLFENYQSHRVSHACFLIG